ncbi:hypothetical protein LWE61_08030 [Sphingobium sufflavum]|uniref:hypothetical protein n=1 Tax=Sphingobium sufflavum TaxID=1129547 RepID=UPI001F2FBD9A|nr:hypothetical protein [Sphingobium sufflavum]MCE7796509.1 hypothetical protein [Sphingobium sufflavum]
MAAKTNEENTLFEQGNDDSTAHHDSTLPAAQDGGEDEDALSAEDEAFAQDLARHSAEEADEEADDGSHEADGDNYTEEFKAAHAVPGEIALSIGDIEEWQYHLRRHSPTRAEHASALALTAAFPKRFRPIEVVEKDGRYHLKNGRYILEAIKAAHPGNEKIMVRAIVFPGTEEEAVAAMCDDVLGSSVATKMEMAHGLLSLQRACGISQIALAERYAGLNEHKVSRMLIAARLQEDFPFVFDILEAPHKAPISFGVTVSNALKSMSEADRQEIRDIAREAVEGGMCLRPNDAIEFLGLLPTAETPVGGPTAKPIIPVESDEILGHDDQPVGARERLADNVERLRLPDVAGMTLMEREAAAEAFIAEIRRHFGLA